MRVPEDCNECRTFHAQPMVPAVLLSPYQERITPERYVGHPLYEVAVKRYSTLLAMYNESDGQEKRTHVEDDEWREAKLYSAACPCCCCDTPVLNCGTPDCNLDCGSSGCTGCNTSSCQCSGCNTGSCGNTSCNTGACGSGCSTGSCNTSGCNCR